MFKSNLCLRQVLIISLAQFLGFSLWFSVSGVSASLVGI